jgi:hypothetical protein
LDWGMVQVVESLPGKLQVLIVAHLEPECLGG